MRVWWCEFHEAAGYVTDCDRRHQSPAGSCRMTEMHLVPVVEYRFLRALADERVAELLKDIEGERPWTADEIAQFLGIER